MGVLKGSKWCADHREWERSPYCAALRAKQGSHVVGTMDPAKLTVPPGVNPYMVVDDDGGVLIVQGSNGLAFSATYRTRGGAERAARRWGGRVVNRQLT